ncbi:MAG: 2-dehydropantoate 2-reductase N-terminal domain-containing protein, partial [Byssovorax sp.]
MSTTATPSGPRLLVVGCGGIGGVVAAHLFEQGHDVTALTTNALIADAIDAGGFRLRGDGSPGVVRGRAVTS